MRAERGAVEVLAAVLGVQAVLWLQLLEPEPEPVEAVLVAEPAVVVELPSFMYHPRLAQPS